MSRDKFNKFVNKLEKEIIKKEIDDHNEHISELFRNPRNWGKPPDKEISVFQNYRGEKGENLQFFLKINEKNIIEKANFFTDGCGCMIAAGSQTTLLIEGKSIEFAQNIKPEVIDEALKGLPDEEKHCAESVATAIRLLIEEFKRKSN